MERPVTGERKWTKRQREVLDLLAQGRTNAEIATALGITFDGAKWHVSEIMSHLGVDSREDAAEYWRTQQGLPSRFTRLRRAILGGVVGKVALAGGALAFAAVAVVVILAWPGDEDPATDPGKPGVTPLTRGENYAYTPAVAYIAPDGTVPVVHGDGTVRTPRLLDGCAPYIDTVVPDALVISALTWSMNGDRAFCLSSDLALRSAWPPDNPAIADVFGPGVCNAGQPRKVFWPTMSLDGLRIACSRGTQPYAMADESGTHDLVVGGTMSNQWSPAGHHVVGQFDMDPKGSPNGGFRWSFFDPTGALRLELRTMPDSPGTSIGWTLDGAMAVLPSIEGVQVLDTRTWTLRTILPGVRTGNARLRWVLDDTAILVPGQPSVIVRVSDYNQRTVPVELAFLGTIAPNTRLAALAVRGVNESESVIQVTDLATGATRILPGSEFPRNNASITWSGDSKRLCWTYLDATKVLAIDCSSADGGSITRAFDPLLPHRSDFRVVVDDFEWHALSPDLSKVAYTVPGLADAESPQELWIADLDGSNAVRIGPIAAVTAFEWQPDAVYRPRRYEP